VFVGLAVLLQTLPSPPPTAAAGAALFAGGAFTAAGALSLVHPFGQTLWRRRKGR